MPRFFHTHALARSAALFLALAAAPAVAQEPVEMSQTVIQSQIQAFLAGDIDTAYSFASPDIKALYPTIERFETMVRSGYGPVYRPGNYAFGRAREISGGAVIQEVLISGPDGNDYTAIYTMERQPDGTMKISGVSLIKSAPPQT
jgi:uncharacterized protein DUF4864